MIITISGQAGAGKSTTAKLLSKILGYKHYSMGDLRRDFAHRAGMTIAEYNKKGETDPSTDRPVEEYQTKLGKTEDNFVIDGRISFHFIPQSFKVHLTADLKTRSQRVFQDERVTEKLRSLPEVKKALVEREKSDQKRYKMYYNLDHLDHKNYDLVLDTTNLAPDQVVQKILDGAKRRGMDVPRLK